MGDPVCYKLVDVLEGALVVNLSFLRCLACPLSSGLVLFRGGRPCLVASKNMTSGGEFTQEASWFPCWRWPSPKKGFPFGFLW